MHYIALDTNTWIYLANGTEPVKLLKYIQDQVIKGNITILLPNIILDEWNTHKENTVFKASIEHFNEVGKALQKIMKLLGNRGEKNVLNFLLEKNRDKIYFKDLFENFKLKKTEIEDAISENIRLIDDLLAHKAILIEVEDHIYKKAGQFALEKKAPFKTKNSFADALIVFSFLEYLKKNSIQGGMFISYNTKDFCEIKNGKKLLHSDLQKDFQDASCKYYKIVGEALRTIKENIISKEEIALIEEIQDRAVWGGEIIYCELCQGTNKVGEVYFRYDMDLLDERSTPNFGTLNSTKNSFKESKDVIEVGNCNRCNTEHFKCIECGYINAVWEGEYNKKKGCENCGMNYLIRREFDRQGIEDTEYIILKDTEICQKCGDEIESDLMVENICINCEEKYSYE